MKINLNQYDTTTKPSKLHHCKASTIESPAYACVLYNPYMYTHTNHATTEYT